VLSRRGMVEDFNPPLQAQLIQWEQSAVYACDAMAPSTVFPSPIRKIED
jgi:hypothetical protein